MLNYVYDTVYLFKLNGVFMAFNKLFVFYVLFMFLGFSSLSGIAHYKAIPLDHLITKNSEDSNLFFEYKVFNKSDCKKYLGRKEVSDRGYQPIQIQITNNTDKSFKFSLNDFSFPCVSCDEVADKVEFNTTKRLVAWGVPAFFIWPLIIPFIIEAVESPKANEQLHADFSKKSLRDQIIEPNSSINGLIFVTKEHFNSSFSFSIANTKNNTQFKLSTIDK